jgi:hypothetical protein
VHRDELGEGVLIPGARPPDEFVLGGRAHAGGYTGWPAPRVRAGCPASAASA